MMCWRGWTLLINLLVVGTGIAVHGSPEAAGPPAGFQPQSLARVVDSQTVVVAGTAPCGPLFCAVVLSGSPGAGGRVNRWRRLQPPPVPRAQSAAALDVGVLAFANSLAGYDLVAASALGHAAKLYATSDAGASWQQERIMSGSVLTLVASPLAFYAVTAHCHLGSCDDYQLARSVPGTTQWSSTPIPGTARLDGNPVDLAVQGTEVFLDFQPPVQGAKPHVLVARDGRGPFKAYVVPRLESVGACSLDPQPGGAVWASCPTGMMVSYLHSQSVAGPYAGVWAYAGTGGGGLVPVTGQIAYRYTGIPTSDLPGEILQRSVNGGRSFNDVGPWPFARSAGTPTTQFLFLNEEEGFGLGAAPSSPRTLEIVETADGGRHWGEVLP